MDQPEIHAPDDLFRKGETKMPKAQVVARAEDAPIVEPGSVSLMRLIERAATSPEFDVDKLQKLLDVKTQWEANEAKKAFVSALNAFKKDPPEIVKNKHVEFDVRGGDKTEYWHATLDQVCEVVGKALSEHGLSHHWDVKQSDDPQNVKITVACVLTHEMGHSERVSITAFPDDSGKKNRIQQIASAITYLQRYTLLAATGLAAGPDDDGEASAADPITTEQKDELIALIKETGADTAKFLAYLGGASLDALPADRFNDARAALERKRRI